MILYRLVKFDEYNDEMEYFDLTAKTDTGARRQVKKLIKENELKSEEWKLIFRNKSDTTGGTLEY